MTSRAAQAEATRERIRQAAVQLYREGSLDGFILDEVARRAETTVQTVLRAFKSKDELIMAALEALSPYGTSIKLSAPGDVAAAVTMIFDLYEAIGDLVLRQLGDEQRLPRLKADVDTGRRSHRDWVGVVFAPQLACHAGEARAQLFQALMVATDVYVWKLLRRDQGLDRAAAESVMRHIVNGVIREA
ncbi:MAG TPA: TetR/AcrR family transcriptional regulator [Stellaceae bacterium]|jgi:AcrR family transcriptional regulator